MKPDRKYLITGLVVLVAVGLVLFKYRDYVLNPWTRDGQIRADIIQITPRVTGPIVELPIRDNQFVQAGDLLFRIDPRTFEADRDRARAQLDETGDSVRALEKQVEAARASVEVARGNIARAESQIAGYDATIAQDKAELERQRELLPQKATSKRALERAEATYLVSLQQKRSAEAQLLQVRSNLLESEASLAEAEARLGAIGEANPQVRAAVAALRQAELNLEFSEVRAPVDGYVTNLTLRLGTQAVANQPALALVDVSTYRVEGFFRENAIGDIRAGDEAVVTLMTYPDRPLEGYVGSLGWGIAQQDGSTGVDLLPNVSPTFEWIRLAQRIPIQIHLTNVPEGVELRVGTTASVLVRTGTAGEQSGRDAVSAPKALQ
ncbi:MAG: HlyD family secretion protein [Gammaproteobacteria bacterium]